MTAKQILLFVVNDAAFFLSHRLPIALKAREDGYDVQVATAPSTAAEEIVRLGFPFHPVPLSRSGRQLAGELGALVALVRLFRTVRPDIVHLVTIKPVIYGGIAARLARVPAVVSAVSGLGTVFLAQGAKARLARLFIMQLYRLAFGHPNMKVIFQNEDDRASFVDRALLSEDRTTIIPGSGVDLAEFAALPEPATGVVVTMTSRLLRDKGVNEFVAAAALVRRRRPEVIFQLAGTVDPGNPTSLTGDEYQHIERDGVVRLLGHRRDIAALLAGSSIVVLPSYREGLPRSLVEAAAAGRAVVTTNVPGCRDAILPRVSGLLVPARDAAALASAIEELATDSVRRSNMGAAGRRLAENKFSIESIVAQHLPVYAELLAEPVRSSTAR